MAWSLRLSLAALILMVGLWPARPVLGAPPVAPELTSLYERMGGRAALGEPVSPRLIINGQIQQYFLFSRLEQSLNGASPTLGRLGVEVTIGRSFASVEPFESTPEHLYFPETGQALAEPFLSLWRMQGGIDRHGFPISGWLEEDGLTVQYFERSRLQINPEGTVELAPIGEIIWSQQLVALAAPTMAEIELTDLINGARRTAGSPPLVIDPAVIDLSRERSRDMAQRGYFGHVTPDGRSLGNFLAERGILYSRAGETIQRNNFSPDQTIQEAFRSLMASPKHREILLDARFHTIGAGHAISENGIHYYTLVVIEV